jgi:hypothetical protein
MADEVQGTVQGPNGESQTLKLKVGGNALGLTTKDLPLIILMILLGVIGYFRTVTMDKSIAAVNTHLQALYARQDQIRHELQQQNVLVQSQTTDLRSAVDEQTKALRRWFITLNWNLAHDANERIPLEFTPEELRRER